MSSIHSCGLSSGEELPERVLPEVKAGVRPLWASSPPHCNHQAHCQKRKEPQLFLSPCQAALSLQRTLFGLQATYLRQSLACWHCDNSGENHSLELQKPKALTLLLWAIWHLGPAPASFQQLSVTYTHTHTCRHTHTYMCMQTNTNTHRHIYVIGKTLSRCLALKKQTL